jgi:hypothetical protein
VYSVVNYDKRRVEKGEMERGDRSELVGPIAARRGWRGKKVN